jgi:hypothetical protein
MAENDKQGGSADSIRSKREHLEALLDEGVNETFPASDPVAVSFMADVLSQTSTNGQRWP